MDKILLEFVTPDLIDLQERIRTISYYYNLFQIVHILV